MVWIDPIFDRTLDDVNLIKELNDKINTKGWSGLTALQRDKWLMGGAVASIGVRGALNYVDLNRVEGNCVYLQERLQSYGYMASVNVKLDWTVEDFFRLADLNRIKQNVLNLAEVYYTLPTTPTITLLPLTLNYTQLNDIEKFIFDLNVILERMIDSFIYCGTFNCGQEIII